MVEQTYTLHYLGCSVLSKGTTGLGVIQKPLKELYFSFRKKQTKSPAEVYMQITREGLNMLTPDGTAQGHQLKSTLYKFPQVSYVEAVQFTSKNNSRKNQYAFMPLDEKRAVSSPEKLFATLEKKNSYLLKMNHQPIIVCLIRRQAGVKALDCHVFISLSSTDALKIVDSFTHMEQLAAQKEYKGDFRPVPSKNNNVNTQHQGPQWDYRTDQRPPYQDHNYPPPGRSDPKNPYDGRYQLRDEHFRGGPPPDSRSPKSNEPPTSSSYGGMQYQPNHFAGATAGGAPMQNYQPRGYPDMQDRGRPYGENPDRGRPYGDIQERGRPISSYFGQTSPQAQPQPQKPPINSSSHNLPVNHSRGSSFEDRMQDYPPEPRYNYENRRYEPPKSRDDQLWNAPRVSPYDRQTNDHGRPLSVAQTNDRGRPLSFAQTNDHGRPLSLAPQGHYTPPGNGHMGPMARTDPRHALSTTDLPSQIQRVNSGPYTQLQEQQPRREPRSASPMNNGPAFSLSNLESRQQLDESNSNGSSTEGHGKPVAKVPPHKIAGVKVLPSSFELPKQRPTSPKPTYKNDEDLYWEKQKAQLRNNPTNNNNNHSPQNRHSSYYPGTNNNYDYNDYQHQTNGKGNLVGGVINTKPGNYNPSQAPDYYRNSSGPPPGNQSDIYSHYNNRFAHEYGNQNGNPALPDRRYGAADYGGPPVGMDRRPPAFYNSEQPKPGVDKRKPDQNGGGGQGDDLMRKKEAELASMFQNMEMQSGNPRVPRYASQADLNFEQSLGYYP